MRHIHYDRKNAVEYAKQWAGNSNPAYPHICGESGDSTNYASQCVYAGSMGISSPKWNYATTAWSNPESLFDYLLLWDISGPRAAEVHFWALEPGDIMQLRSNRGFWKTLVITRNIAGKIWVSAHSYHSDERLLESYNIIESRCLHILDVLVE